MDKPSETRLADDAVDSPTRHILVTGGFGFLGSHLVEELVKDPNCHVHVVDDLSTSPLDCDEYLSELGHPASLTHSTCTVEEYCQPSMAQEFQQIYHLASVVGPAGVLPHAGRIVRSVVNDTCRLIELALRWNAKLVDVSTSEVYGGGQNGFCTEEYPKIVPAKVTVRLEYAVGKLAAETALMNTCLVSPLRASIVRPFNIAGPRQSGKGGFVLPRFVAQSLKNVPVTVFGTGQQIRAFTHVKDMVDGLIRVMEGGKPGIAYNLGNPDNRITVLELAQRVIRLTCSKSEITLVDPKTIYGPLYAEASDKYPDATRARTQLGWRPKYDIDRVIFDTVEAHRAKESVARRLCSVAANL